MAFEVSEFQDVHQIRGELMPIPFGDPIEVHKTTGPKELDPATKFIRIKGPCTITWPNGKSETFDGVECRGIRGATTIGIT